MSEVEPKRKKRKRESEAKSDFAEREVPMASQSDSRRSSKGVKAYSLKRLDPKKFQPGFLDALENDQNALANVQLTTDKIEAESSRVWILQCPANVNIAELVGGKKINLEGTTQLELESPAGDMKQYEAVGLPKSGGTEKPENMVALLPDESGEPKLVAAPINGYIMIRESLEELPVPKLLANPKPPHTLPKGIKERHPIYGADFSKVFEEISSRAKNKQKKKKKKRRGDRDELSVDTPQQLPNTDAPLKSKSKLNGSMVSSPAFIKTEPITPKKKKRTDDHFTNGTNYTGLSNGQKSKESSSSSATDINSITMGSTRELEIIKKRSKKSKRKLESV